VAESRRGWCTLLELCGFAGSGPSGSCSWRSDLATLFALDELGRCEDSGGLGDLDDERCDPPHHRYIPTELLQAAR
jgi:hypothetical protein